MESSRAVNPCQWVTANLEGTVAALRDLAAALDAVDEMAASRAGVGRSDLRVLEALSREGGASTPAQLAARVRLSRPGLSAVLNRLEAAGLVSRELNPADRRSVRVRITAAATAQLAPVFDRVQQVTASVLGGLDSDDLAMLGSTIAGLVTALNACVE